MILSQFTVWPEAGGLLDQDPLFLRRLGQYTVLKSRADERKKAQEKNKSPNVRRRGRR
jgi:hypothetical protein